MDEIKEIILFHIEECVLKEEFDGEPTIDKEKLINDLAKMISIRENALKRKLKSKK